MEFDEKRNYMIYVIKNCSNEISEKEKLHELPKKLEQLMKNDTVHQK